MTADDSPLIDAPIQPRFTALAVCAFTGISYRQLDYGVRQQHYPCAWPARGSGSLRIFSMSDLVEIIRITARRELAEQIYQSTRFANPKEHRYASVPNHSPQLLAGSVGGSGASEG